MSVLRSSRPFGWRLACFWGTASFATRLRVSFSVTPLSRLPSLSPFDEILEPGVGGHWHCTQQLADRQAVLNRAETLVPPDPEVAVAIKNDSNAARLAHRYLYFAFPKMLDRAGSVFLDTRRSHPCTGHQT